MTEKEKAKAYDEALERASAEYKDNNRHFKATLEEILPELKENDDKKIKNAILNYFKNMLGNCQDDVCDVHVEDAIAWVEKQQDWAKINERAWLFR